MGCFHSNVVDKAERFIMAFFINSYALCKHDIVTFCVNFDHFVRFYRVFTFFTLLDCFDSNDEAPYQIKLESHGLFK